MAGPQRAPRNTLGRGVRDRGQMALFRERVPNSAIVYSDSPSGTLTLSGTISEDRGTLLTRTVPGVGAKGQPRRRNPVNAPRTWRPTPVRTPTQANADGPTGALVLSGTATEARTGTDAPSGALILAGTVTEAKITADHPSGTLLLAGTDVEAKATADRPSGALILAGTDVEAKLSADSRTGALLIAGTVTEAKTAADAPSGALVFAGTVVDAHATADTDTGQLTFTGTAADAYTPPGGGTTYIDAPTGAIVFSGSAGEHILVRPSPGGGRTGRLPAARRTEPLPPKRFSSTPRGTLRISGRIVETHTMPEPWVKEEEEVELLLALA